MFRPLNYVLFIQYFVIEFWCFNEQGLDKNKTLQFHHKITSWNKPPWIFKKRDTVIQIISIKPTSPSSVCKFYKKKSNSFLRENPFTEFSVINLNWRNSFGILIIILCNKIYGFSLKRFSFWMRKKVCELLIKFTIFHKIHTFYSDK